MLRLEIVKANFPEVLNKINLMEISKSELRNLLRFADVSMVMDGMTRVQSHLFADLEVSMCQQSQRYVNMDNMRMVLPYGLDDTDMMELRALNDRAKDLYLRMSARKEEFKDSKGRPTKDWYEHGILIEDARYILPLSCETAITATMNGSKLIDLYEMMYKFRFTFNDMKRGLSMQIPQHIHDALVKHSSIEIDKYTPGILNHYLSQLPDGESVKIVDMKPYFKDAYKNLPAIAAMTSSSEAGPVSYHQWFENGTADRDPLKTTLFSAFGCKHLSLVEEIRFSYVAEMSLSAYHQQQRHRLNERIDGSICGLVNGTHGFTVPKDIQGTQFEEEYLELVQEYRVMGAGFKYKYGPEYVLYTLLNCDHIRLFINENFRNHMALSQMRMCKNAQTEIRGIYTDLFEQLLEWVPSEYMKNCAPKCVSENGCIEGKASYSCKDVEYIQSLRKRLEEAYSKPLSDCGSYDKSSNVKELESVE